MTKEQIYQRIDELDEVVIMTAVQMIEYSKLIKMLRDMNEYSELIKMLRDIK